MAITGQNEVLSDRYINNKLDEAAKAAFEIAMMEDPDILQHVQTLDALKQNLASAPEIFTKPVSAVILPFRSWIRQPMSLAASLLVATLGINAVNEGGFGQSPSSDSLPIGSVILLEGTRGNAGATFSGSPPYLFQIDVGFGNPVGDLRVTLNNRTDNSTVIQLDGLQADPDGWVRMVLNEPLAGDYEVTLDSIGPNGAAEVRRFPINVVPAN